MLKIAQARRRRSRPLPSQRQQYQEYLLQRIETYKNSLGRARLLELGGEAAADMHEACEGQFLLTEVLMQEAVDRLIMKRLKLPSFTRWKQQFARLRLAQREPTHWSLEPDCALAVLLPRIEAEDPALVAGPAAEPAACLLAAHDAAVTFIAWDLGAVDRVEMRLADEALASISDCFFVQPGCWLPEAPLPFELVVLDAGAFAEVEPPARAAFLRQVQERTAPGGVHVLLPGAPGLAPEALLSGYDGWTGDEMGRSRRRGAARRSPGIVLTRPGPGPEERRTDAPESARP